MRTPGQKTIPGRELRCWDRILYGGRNHYVVAVYHDLTTSGPTLVGFKSRFGHFIVSSEDELQIHPDQQMFEMENGMSQAVEFAVVADLTYSNPSRTHNSEKINASDLKAGDVFRPPFTTESRDFATARAVLVGVEELLVVVTYKRHGRENRILETYRPNDTVELSPEQVVEAKQIYVDQIRARQNAVIHKPKPIMIEYTGFFSTLWSILKIAFGGS